MSSDRVLIVVIIILSMPTVLYYNIIRLYNKNSRVQSYKHLNITKMNKSTLIRQTYQSHQLQQSHNRPRYKQQPTYKPAHKLISTSKFIQLPIASGPKHYKHYSQLPLPLQLQMEFEEIQKQMTLNQSLLDQFKNSLPRLEKGAKLHVNNNSSSSQINFKLNIRKKNKARMISNNSMDMETSFDRNDIKLKSSRNRIYNEVGIAINQNSTKNQHKEEKDFKNDNKITEEKIDLRTVTPKQDRQNFQKFFTIEKKPESINMGNQKQNMNRMKTMVEETRNINNQGKQKQKQKVNNTQKDKIQAYNQNQIQKKKIENQTKQSGDQNIKRVKTMIDQTRKIGQQPQLDNVWRIRQLKYHGRSIFDKIESIRPKKP